MRARGDGWERRAGPRLGEPQLSTAWERGGLPPCGEASGLSSPSCDSIKSRCSPRQVPRPFALGLPSRDWGCTAVGGTENGGCGRRDRALPEAVTPHWPCIEADFWAEPNGPSMPGSPPPDCLRGLREPADGVTGANTGPVGPLETLEGLRGGGGCCPFACHSVSSPQSLQIGTLGCRLWEDAKSVLRFQAGEENTPLSWGSPQPRGCGHTWREEVTCSQMS